MARKPAAKPALAAFATLLAGHLAAGTRPAKAAGEPWTDAAFAREVDSAREDKTDGASPRSVSNWRKGTALPSEIEPILRALFGPGTRHAEAREALRTAFQQALLEKSQAIVGKSKNKPPGRPYVADGDQFTRDRTPKPSDARAAADPLRQQKQREILEMAVELEESAKRLSNTQTWRHLSPAAAKLRAAVSGDPRTMPERLVPAYAAMIRLGGTLETDIRVQKDHLAPDGPLDADIHGLLAALVRLAAPWLRDFPTVEAWDVAAGNTLARPDLFQNAADFIRSARAEKSIAEADVEDLDMLSDAARVGDFLGEKAGAIVAGDVSNLILTMAETGASPDAAGSLLARRATATLAGAKPAVDAFIDDMQPDLGEAVRSLVADGPRLAQAGRQPSVESPDPPPPEDVEAAARGMILEGRAPPEAWRPLIQVLDFVGSGLKDLSAVSGLTALLSLNLTGTQVSDVSPASDLIALQTLYLAMTPVSDVSPLSGLSALQDLSLTETNVSDVSPLSSLTALRSIYLPETPVSDVSALSGLASLQDLRLMNTRVSDVSSLSGLTALRALDLSGTQVSDVSPLSGLTALQSLDLWNTKVNDVSPLSGLPALQSLSLTGTPVSDVSPLSGLTALLILDLRGTPVSDVSPLSGLTALQTLNLMDTQVSDVSSLSGLTALESLDLRGTPVTDVAPLSGLTALRHLNLWGTPVSDVSPLSGLTALLILDLRGTPVSDVSPLSGLTALRHLYLRGTPVTDVSPLAHIPDLEINWDGPKAGRHQPGK